MYRFDQAVARYGVREYPLTGFPVKFNKGRIRAKLREYFPGDGRVERIEVVRMKAIPEVNIPDTLSVRFPDNSVEVQYVKQQGEA